MGQNFLELMKESNILYHQEAQVNPTKNTNQCAVTYGLHFIIFKKAKKEKENTILTPTFVPNSEHTHTHRGEAWEAERPSRTGWKSVMDNVFYSKKAKLISIMNRP